MAALVLAIEPDLRQATILKRIVRDRVKADVSVVESPDAALTAIGIRIPDVLLLSALLSPRDEDELMGHLRSLDGADHIQTHTIPQLATTDADQEQGGRRGLLGVFKRKKETPQPIVSGCDPDMFAEEILTFIERAAEKKEENIAALQSRVISSSISCNLARSRPPRRPLELRVLRALRSLSKSPRRHPPNPRGPLRSNGGRARRRLPERRRVPSPWSLVLSLWSTVRSPRS